MLLINVQLRDGWYARAVKFISRHSYGIYLIHVLVLAMLSHAGISWRFLNPVTGIVLTLITCLLISSTAIWLLSKLPCGKYIAGTR